MSAYRVKVSGVVAAWQIVKVEATSEAEALEKATAKASMRLYTSEGWEVGDEVEDVQAQRVVEDVAMARPKSKRKRERDSGRYAPAVERPCKCGHGLGVHTAVRVLGGQPCLNADVGDGERCDCTCFTRCPPREVR